MSDLKFGVEMEFMAPVGYHNCQEFHGVLKYVGNKQKLDIRTGYDDSRTKYWHAHYDGSLHDVEWRNIPQQRRKQLNELCGVEISSPILSGRKGFNQLKKVCNFLESSGCSVNSTCGLHVHIDAKKFSKEEKFAVVARYAHLSNVIDNLVNENRRANNNRFAQNHPLDYEVVSSYFRHINHSTYWDYSTHNYKIEISVRYPTIEFRHHHGSINFNEISNWVNFCMNFTNQSVKMYRQFIRNNPDKEDVYLNRLKDNNPFVGLSNYRKNKLLVLKQIAA